MYYTTCNGLLTDNGGLPIIRRMAGKKEVTLQIRIDPELGERIEAYRLKLAVDGHGIQSRSEVIRRLLESGLEQGLAKPKRK